MKKLNPMLSAILAVLILAMAVPVRADDSPQEKPPAKKPLKYSVEPEYLTRGRKHEVLIRSTPAADLSKYTVRTPEGSNIEVHGNPTFLDDNKTLSVVLYVRGDARLGSNTLKLSDGTSEFTAGISVTELEPLAKQPTPNGMSEVDAMWAIQPKKIAESNFGIRVAELFYTIEVVVGNNMGYDLEVVRVSFDSLLACEKVDGQTECKDTEPRTTIPSSGSQMVRGVIERGQVNGKKHYAKAILQTVGEIMSGAIPFFGNLRPQAHFTNLANITNGPLRNGTELIFPDRTIRQLGRLGDQGLQNSLIIQNNSQAAFVVFIPKDLFQWPNQLDKDSLWKVTKRLGNLVLVGNQIKALQRTIVVGRAIPPPKDKEDQEEPKAAPADKQKTAAPSADKKPASNGTTGDKEVTKPDESKKPEEKKPAEDKKKEDTTKKEEKKP